MGKQRAKKLDTAFRRLDRPEIALITNHGYGGAKIPVGGAPDTGGQNFYVNTLAQKLEILGYKVTLFARGGFPFFKSHRIRRTPEYLSENIRYVFVPGGGDGFLHKEDIAVALDEQLDWLVGFCRKEAQERGCRPWELYEFINTHYWDAAVLAVGLVERWRNRIVARSLHRLLKGVVCEEIFAELREGLDWRALGEVPDAYLGRLLIYHVGLNDRPVRERVRSAATLWASSRGLDAASQNRLVDRVLEQLERKDVLLEPRYEQLVVAAALGREILSAMPKVDEQLKRTLARADRHVWTPHSLGELKDYNYRNRPPEVRRSLKFCERRSHERMVCQRTHAFAATSAQIAERLWTHYRVPVEDTFYFPPCVDREVFRPHSPGELRPTYRWLAETTGLSQTELEQGTIVFETSRMDRTKRKDLVLAGFAKIASDYPGSYLLIGGGPKNDVFENLQDQLAYTRRLDGRAFLLGAIPDEHIGPMFAVADVYATASEMEGFGMSVSQAASAATAVVSTDTVPFSAHHAADQALMFRPGDVDGFVEALAALLADPEECQRRGLMMERQLDGLDWLKRTQEFLAYLNQRGFGVREGKPG